MKTASAFLTIGCMTAALTLAACGGGSSNKAATPASTTTQASTTDTTAAATTTAATTTTDPNAPKLLPGTTPPGTTLKVGDTAKVQLQPLSGTSSDDEARFQLEATVTKIRKATAADFKNINLDAKQKKATPYFVNVRLANKSDKSIPIKGDDPDVRISAVDDREQEQNSVIFIGDFPACNNADPPKPFSKGKSYDTCLVFLIPGGGTMTGVTWSSGIEYVDKPITWKFSG